MKRIVDEIKKILEKISEKTHLGKGIVFAAFLLVCGAAVLVASEISAKEANVPSQTESESTDTYAQEYASMLEERLESIISSISGAGKTNVMITLESGGEDIYLHDYDYGENSDTGGKNSVERKDEYVIIDGSHGEQGIIVKRAEPEIRGVAVVCQGGGSELVCRQITETVTALLNISSARVSVAKMNE